MMRRRLYFLLPDVHSTSRAVDELLLKRVDATHIHVIANDETLLTELPRASILQKSDLIHGLEIGLVLGGSIGFIAGLFAAFYPAIALQPEGMVVLLSTLAGAIIGAWSSSMIAVDVPNTRLARFKRDLKKGLILLMVDVPKERVSEINEMMESRHPAAGNRGVEPSIPAFP
jgi:hypothetical protein